MTTLSRYLRPQSQTSKILLLSATVMLALAVWLGLQAYRQHVQLMRMSMRVEQLRAAQVQRPPPKISQVEQDELKRWEGLRAERAFAWPPLFAAIEHAGSADIELLDFQPDKGSKRILLRGEAKDQKGLSGFLDRLAAQPVLRDVHLTHQQIKVHGNLQTIEFEIKATILQ